MSFRWLCIEVTATLVSLLCGCVEPNVGPVPPPAPVVDDVAEPAVVTVAASASAYAELKAWTGGRNTVTFSEAMRIERPEVTVNVPAGASVSYDMGESEGTFQFHRPLPTVEAKVLGFRISPTLSKVVLKSDGDGSASTGVGTYSFRWLADAPTAAKKPQVWAYSTAGCVPCKRAKDELAAEKDLPFEVIWKEGPRPACVTGAYPAFWWHVSRDAPSCEDAANTRVHNGYAGVRDLVERWKANRVTTTTTE